MDYYFMESWVPISTLIHYFRNSQGFENIECLDYQSDFAQLEQNSCFVTFLRNICFVFHQFWLRDFVIYPSFASLTYQFIPSFAQKY